MAFTSVGILGGGAWGTALAAASAEAGLETLLWAREKEVVEAINKTHENTTFLKGAPLDPKIRATETMTDLTSQDFILLVPPAQFLRPTLKDLKPNLRSKTPLVVCSKGIEKGTGALMSEVLDDVVPDNPVAILSGPTFAIEVARNLPSAVTIAAENEQLAHELTDAIGHPTFRPYWTDDIIGAQIGGSIKNILAIACGIVDGLKMGENARAALMTRGAAEMIRFAKAKGGRPETLMGLCGIGDLILTCSSIQSRNMSLGKAIGEGKTLDDIMSKRKTVAEGAHSAVIVHEIAKTMNIDMPICSAVYRILHEKADLAKEIKDLLNRPFSPETE